MMDFTIINNQKPFVIMEWEMCRRLLDYLPKSALIVHFAPDKATELIWGVTPNAEIIERIFIEYETQ